MALRRPASSWILFVVVATAAMAVPITESPPALAAPTVVYVDASATGGDDGSSWGNAFVELQSALAVAVSGDEIWIAEGTHLPDYDPIGDTHTGNTSDSFVLPAGTAMYGQFPAGGGDGTFGARNADLYQTVLSGDLAGDDGPNHTNTTDNALYVLDVSAADVVDGVTVTASGADAGILGDGASVVLNDINAVDNHGLGLYMVNGSAFEMRNSKVARNQNTGAGGGMYLTGGGSALLVEVLVEDNVGGNGGGIFAGVPITIINSVFRGNAGCYDCNIGINGGALTVQGTATIVNTLFSGNRAYQGSAIRAWFDHPTVINCTFVGNDANNGGTIDGSTSSALTMVNSIMWDNDANAEIQDLPTTTVSYSIVEGGFAGTEVSNWDPQFIDADGADDTYGTSDDNVRLGASSPAIDNGDNTSVPADVGDIDGDADTTEITPLDLDRAARFVDRPNADGGVGTAPFVDLGAYELPQNPPTGVPDPYDVDEDHTLVRAAPGVLDNDWDPEGDPMTAQLYSGPSHGNLDFQEDGSFEYTAHQHWWGTDTFVYRAYDGLDHSGQTTVTIDVAPINDPPEVSDADAPFIIPGSTSCVDIHGSVLNVATDPDNEPLTAHLYTDATHVDVTLNPDGTWCAEAAGPWPGTDTFWWRAYDGKLFSNPARVNLTTRPFDELADLTLTKTADPDPVEIGELLRYTITVRNDGPDPATQVTVTDVLSPLVQFSSASDECLEDGGTVTCDIGTLGVGATRVLQITVTPVAAGQIDNIADANLHEIDVDGDHSATATVNASGPPEPTDRIAGTDRILTAIDASRTTYLDGEAGAVVLARSDLFPDALAGSVLTVAYDAPLLLTPSTRLDGRVEAEIRRVLPSGGTVFLLGGEAALSSAIEQRLRSIGYDPVRLGGRNRYATAIAIASAVPEAKTILLATAQDFADALAAGAAAAAVDGVVVLTDGDRLPGESVAFINARPSWPRYAIGGPATRADPGAVPIFGSNRYATAIAVAERFFHRPVVVGVAVGTRFPDALGGAGHIGRRGGPMLLTAPTNVPGSVATYLNSNRVAIERAYIYGGPAAVSLEVEQTIGSLID